MDIWNQENCEVWHTALKSYPQVIAAQGSERLVELDSWYMEKLPSLIAGRSKPYVTLEELRDVTSWKMARGVWRERNRLLVSGNPPDRVIEASRKAFTQVPDLRGPIATLSELAGVGPATASAVMAAYAPESYPFFDELVAAQIPDLGPVTFTAKYYLAYAEALRERTARLNAACPDTEWTPQDVSQALWANSGGKINSK
jgi:hypothetical protein